MKGYTVFTSKYISAHIAGYVQESLELSHAARDKPGNSPKRSMTISYQRFMCKHHPTYPLPPPRDPPRSRPVSLAPSSVASSPPLSRAYSASLVSAA